MCPDIFSISILFNSSCHFIKKCCLQPNDTYKIKRGRNDKDPSRFALPHTVVILYMWLFKLKLSKIKNPMSQSHQPHFKTSTASMWQVAIILDSAEIKHFHQCRKLYQTSSSTKSLTVLPLRRPRPTALQRDAFEIVDERVGAKWLQPPRCLPMSQEELG